MMNNHNICVIGLGYVGYPLIKELSKKFNVIGIDNSKKKIEKIRKLEIKNKKINQITSNFSEIKKCNFIIVCIPTPIKYNKEPNLNSLINVSKNIGLNLKKNSTVVFESTVYPGVTEEICIPIIEKYSDLEWKKDFSIGYSPERISPGDNNDNLTIIPKIISADNKKTMNNVKSVYKKIIKAQLYEANSIKVAEAAKILENIQRDVNIALINEVSIIFEKLGINTQNVIDAASTKWNFHKYYPGLVGGHCISVDPYYLLHKSYSKGFKPFIINAARNRNNQMSNLIFKRINNLYKKNNKKNIKVLILGLTYKENIDDLRNSQSFVLLDKFIKFKYNINIHDPMIKKNSLNEKYMKYFIEWNKIKKKYDILITVVKHNFYIKKGKSELFSKIKKDGLIYDVKNFFNESDVISKNLKYLQI